MKHWLQTTSAVLALAVCTGTASAQTAPPRPDFSAMRQMHQQMDQIQAQARTQMLNALTPAHRTLLANVAGQLAVSPTPDFRAAAQQLETALSPAEKQAILAANSAERTQMRSLMEKARAQMPPPPAGASPRPARPPFGGPNAGPGGPGRQRTAGTVLLRSVTRSSGPSFMRRPS